MVALVQAAVEQLELLFMVMGLQCRTSELPHAMGKSLPDHWHFI